MMKMIGVPCVVLVLSLILSVSNSLDIRRAGSDDKITVTSIYQMAGNTSDKFELEWRRGHNESVGYNLSIRMQTPKTGAPYIYDVQSSIKHQGCVHSASYTGISFELNCGGYIAGEAVAQLDFQFNISVYRHSINDQLNCTPASLARRQGVENRTLSLFLVKECYPGSAVTVPPTKMPGSKRGYVWIVPIVVGCVAALLIVVVHVKGDCKQFVEEEGEDDRDSMLGSVLSLRSRIVSPPRYTDVYPSPDKSSADVGPVNGGGQLYVDLDLISTTACRGSLIEGKCSLQSGAADASLEADSETSFTQHMSDEVERFMISYQQSTSLIRVIDNDSFVWSVSSMESSSGSGVPGNSEDQSAATDAQVCVFPSRTAHMASPSEPEDSIAVESDEEKAGRELYDEVQQFISNYQQSTAVIRAIDNNSLDYSLASMDNGGRSRVPSHSEDVSAAKDDQACKVPSMNAHMASLSGPQGSPAVESDAEEVDDLCSSWDYSLSSMEDGGRSRVHSNSEDQTSTTASLGGLEDSPAAESGEGEVGRLPLQRNEGRAAVTDLSHQERCPCPFQHTSAVFVVLSAGDPPAASNVLAKSESTNSQHVLQERDPCSAMSTSTDTTRQDVPHTPRVMIPRWQVVTDV